VASAIDALGATARDISMVEMADSVSKGVVDGALVGIETLKSFKMADVCKYTTFAWQVGNMYTFYLAMNNEKWNALPNDLKKVFNDVSTEYMEKYAEAWNQIDIDGINYSLSIPGNEVIKLTDAEGQRWWQTVQPVISDYTTTMVGQGYKQSDIEAYLKYIQDRITYWQAEEAKRNIPSPFDVTLPTS
jgi:TRAP-type C4-dicarboxylate transport system substrate-binding protein